MPPATPDPPPIKEGRQEEVSVRRVPVDVLFDFDKYLLKRGERTANALNLRLIPLSQVDQYVV